MEGVNLLPHQVPLGAWPYFISHIFIEKILLYYVASISYLNQNNLTVYNLCFQLILVKFFQV